MNEVYQVMSDFIIIVLDYNLFSDLSLYKQRKSHHSERLGWVRGLVGLSCKFPYVQTGRCPYMEDGPLSGFEYLAPCSLN